MKRAQANKKLIYIQLLGFSLIIALSWLDELVLLPRLIMGLDSWPNGWREATLETISTTLVAIPVVLISARLVNRLQYIEGFLRTCAWCKRLDLDGRWVPMEEYFGTKSHIEFSHSICEECSAKLL